MQTCPQYFSNRLTPVARNTEELLELCNLCLAHVVRKHCVNQLEVGHVLVVRMHVCKRSWALATGYFPLLGRPDRHDIAHRMVEGDAVDDHLSSRKAVS